MYKYSNKLDAAPALYVCSNHPLVFPTLKRILAAAVYDVKPFSMVEPFEEHGWILILDTCSVGEWLEVVVHCRIRGGRSIVLVPSGLQTQEEEIRLIYLGVGGIVALPQVENELLQAVSALRDGHLWFRRDTLDEYVRRTNRLRGQLGDSRFTVREEQILIFLVNGSSNKEISNTLGISNRTVKFHVSNILRKFNVESRKELLPARKKSGSQATSQMSRKAGSA